MFCVMWEYELRPGMCEAFEALYGAQGEWARLFREHPGFSGTELLRDRRPGRYVSVDRWESERHYDSFLERASARYAQLDARGDGLTVHERKIGRYTAC